MQDNVGTIKLIDAAKKTGSVKKIVLVSSILTNGRNWGQEKSPGFVVTNAFGNVLVSFSQRPKLCLDDNFLLIF